MTTLTQRTFSSGEVSPSLYARVDTVKYATGLRTCNNCMVLRYGGVSNRPGTEFISEVGNSQRSVRLVPFVFNQFQTYILEFGDYYMRVFKDGIQQTDSTQTISGVTLGVETTITSTTHGLTTGQEVYLNGVKGSVQLNNRNFKVDVVDENNFKILNMDNTALNSSSYDAYVSGGMSYGVFEIETPYSYDEVKEFKYVQSADVITFAHQNHRPQELLRYGDTNWVIQELQFDPNVTYPTGTTVSGGPTGTKYFSYTVTAVNAEGEESLPASGSGSKSITNITQASPAVMTLGTAHGL